MIDIISKITLFFLSSQTGGGLAVGTVLLIGETLTCQSEHCFKGPTKWNDYFLNAIYFLLKPVWVGHKTVRNQLSVKNQL